MAAVVTIMAFSTPVYRFYIEIFKAGLLVGSADCYAAIVLADNATFLLAVNRIAAFR